MNRAGLKIRTTRDILKDGVTLILFSEGGRTLAEVIGPEGHEDAVMAMPAAILQAVSRTLDPAFVAVLDDEGLWQEEWGTLQDPSCAPAHGT